VDSGFSDKRVAELLPLAPFVEPVAVREVTPKHSLLLVVVVRIEFPEALRAQAVGEFRHP
jgi:hypothetical protein